MLIAWENEAFLADEEFGKGKFDIIVPSISILAEPPVALVDANVDQKGTRKQAEAYLQFLYTPEAQRSSPRTSTARATRRRRTRRISPASPS